MAERVGDCAVLERQANQGSGPDGSGEAQSAFRPLGVQGGLCSFVPMPGPLHRILCAQSPEDACLRQSQASVMNLQRNAISSSYSSTRDFPPVERRRHTRLPQRSSETVGQEGSQAPSSVSMFSQRKSRPEKNQDGTRRQKRSWRSCSPASDSSRSHKCKVPLLPHRGRESLRVPPPPGLQFRDMAEDIKAEKKALFQHISSALQGEAEAISGSGAPEPLPSSPLPEARTAPIAIFSTPPTNLPITSAVSVETPQQAYPRTPQPASGVDITPMDTNSPT